MTEVRWFRPAFLFSKVVSLLGLQPE